MRRNILRVVSRLASAEASKPTGKSSLSDQALKGYRSRFDPKPSAQNQLGKNGKYFHPEFSATWGLHHSNPPPEHFGLEKADFIITDNMVAKSNMLQGNQLPPMDPEKHLIYRGGMSEVWQSYMYFGRIFEVKKIAKKEVASAVRTQVVSALYNTFKIEELKDFEVAKHRTFGVYDIDIAKRWSELLEKLALEVIVPQSQLRPVVEQLLREQNSSLHSLDVAKLNIGQIVDAYCDFVLALQEEHEAKAAKLPSGITEGEAKELEKLRFAEEESTIVKISKENDTFINRMMSCLH